MSEKSKPHPKNVPGDFYVEDGCCTTCDVPFYYAPGLFKYEESEMHCFVAKQPADDEEVYQMIKAVICSELECIRYSGENPQILRRLAEAGASEACDARRLVRGISPLLRNHVAFSYSLAQTEFEIAVSLKKYILSQNENYNRYKVTAIKVNQNGAAFSFSWYQENYYEVCCDRIESTGDWHLFHSPGNGLPGSRSVSLLIDE